MSNKWQLIARSICTPVQHHGKYTEVDHFGVESKVSHAPVHALSQEIKFLFPVPTIPLLATIVQLA